MRCDFFLRLKRLFRTSAIRLSLRYALLQTLLLAASLGVLLSLANRYVAAQLEAGLASESSTLAALPLELLTRRVEALTDARGPRHYLLLDARGVKLAGDLAAWPEALPADGHVHRIKARADDPEAPHETESLVLRACGTRLPTGGRLLTAQEPGAAEDLRDYVFAAGAVVLGLSGLLSLILGFALGRQWLARIEAINRTAGAIAAGDFSQRVNLHGRADEFDLLAEHLNHMLARIEAAVAGMRDVSDNVAHDLRKPLTRLKTRIEVLLAQPREAGEYRAALAQTGADADELMRTFDALLSIARLEAGGEMIAPQRFDLADAVRGVTELYAAEAEDAGRPFRMAIESGVWVSGAPALLSQALANLLDNAFKYTPPDAAVTVKAHLAEDGVHARLGVCDSGPGIAPADRVRLVQRFARGDAARSQPGSGLGLSLVTAVARAHGGTLELADAPGGGLAATLLLPLAPAPRRDGP